MAITAKKYSDIYTITESEQTALEATHAEGHLAHLAIHPEDNPFIAGVLKEIKDLQKELDYLRTEISANKDKTGITSSQANAITANTAKTGITSTQATSITDNTTSIASNKTAIGNITTFPGFGTTKDTALAGNTYIPPIRVNLASGLVLTAQVRIIPPQKGQKKGTAELTWILDDTSNRVLYTGTQNLT